MSSEPGEPRPGAPVGFEVRARSKAKNAKYQHPVVVVTYVGDERAPGSAPSRAFAESLAYAAQDLAEARAKLDRVREVLVGWCADPSQYADSATIETIAGLIDEVFPGTEIPDPPKGNG